MVSLYAASSRWEMLDAGGIGISLAISGAARDRMAVSLEPDQLILTPIAICSKEQSEKRVTAVITR